MYVYICTYVCMYVCMHAGAVVVSVGKKPYSHYFTPIKCTNGNLEEENSKVVKSHLNG